ncbi:MAG: tRNA (adenosine(37)-N6)-dimethylallyltransferase MiaA [Leptospira sp.]|nr:tRNA (adenosine(37)-N6)-dimethylallyltransferase MiaA [Leptospira sp.]
MTEEDSLPGIVILTGPTGSGKTKLVTSLDSDVYEVVSFDSRQVYKDIPVGTTAPNEEERSLMPHAMVGYLNSDENLDANLFRHMARESVQSILKRNKIPILMAGTGFYLRAFLYGMYPVPKISEETRQIVNNLSDVEVLHQLESLDMHAYQKISPNDFYRYRRALEVNLSGQKWSQLGEKTEGGFLDEIPGVSILGLFIDWDRKILYERINQRAKSILEPMIEEAKSISLRYGRNCPGLKSLGYNFALDYIDGTLNVESFYEEIAKAHRNYAKRQITWFRKEPLIRPVSWDYALGTLVELQLLKKNKK